MSRRALLLLLTLTLVACARTEPAPLATALELDCAKGFEALATAIAGQPGLVAAPQESGEPYRFYNAEDGKVSYMLTQPGAPGHPAILKQAAGGETTGCAFGDKAGYDQLVAYLASLGAARAR